MKTISGKPPREADQVQIDQAAGQQRLRLLAELGYGLLESGQTGGQTKRVLDSCGRSLGLSNLSNNNFGRIILLEADLPDGTVVTTSGAADTIDAIDCARSRELNRLADEISAEGPNVSLRDQQSWLTDMRGKVQQVRRENTPSWIIILGMTLLAFCISVQLPISWEARFTTAFVQLIVSLAALAIGRFTVPKLFSAAALSLVSGTVVTILVLISLVEPVDGTAAIAVTCLLILPLPQIIGSITDAIEGDLLSSLGRVFAVAVAGMGIFIGQAVTFLYGEWFNMDHPDLGDLAGIPVPPLYLILVFSALGAIGNALANGGRFDLVLPAAILGATTAATNQFFKNTDWGLGMNPIWASSLSAVGLGLITVIFVIRTGYPQQVLSLMGFTGALLPGFQVFQGIMNVMGEAEARGNSIPDFATAGYMCVGVGIGVSFGAYLANETLTLLKAPRADTPRNA